MKQRHLIFIPVLALSFLVGCNGGGSEPQVTYTVAFDSKGGTPNPDSQTIKHGEQVVKPNDPAKEGFTFGGWYTDEVAVEHKYDFSSPVVSDLTLYAKWNKIDNLVTVTFDAGEGTFANGEHTFQIGVDRNSELNLCLNIIHKYGEPTLTDYTFAYYDYKDTNKGIGYNDIVTNDVTIRANYFPTADHLPYKDLNNISWEVIKKVAITTTKSYMPNLFSVGATKDIYFDYSGTKVKHTVQILDFRTDHLHYDEGERTTLSAEFAGITFDFRTVISDSDGSAITTKWDSSDNKDFEDSTFNKLLNKNDDCIFNRLPDDLKNIIEEVDEKVAHGDNYEVLPRFTTKLYPLAHNEMVPSADGAKDEGTRYKYYNNDDDTSVRIKKDSKGDAKIYWLRSPYTNESDKAWGINGNGEPYRKSSISIEHAFAPAFCI